MLERTKVVPFCSFKNKRIPSSFRLKIQFYEFVAVVKFTFGALFLYEFPYDKINLSFFFFFPLLVCIRCGFVVYAVQLWLPWHYVGLCHSMYIILKLNASNKKIKPYESFTASGARGSSK